MKISLRLRCALLTASLLILCCIALLLITGYSNNMMLSNIKEVTSSHSSALPYAPLKAFDDQENLNELRLFLGFAGVIAFGTFTSYWVAGIALRPLRNLTNDIKNITDQNLHTALPVPKVHDEIGDLATSFNEMLHRLERAFQKEKRFSANVAHELKTPLTILRTKYEVLAMSPAPSPEAYESVLTVSKENVERLIKVVDCLLTLQTATSTLSFQKVDLSHVIHDVLAVLAPLANASRVRIHASISSCFLQANKDLLYRAFFNLIENAIKYNKADGVIRLSHAVSLHHITLYIEDTGIGIPPESIPHLFDAFYRVDPSRNRSIGGSGLGLTLASEIIKCHEGTLLATSVLGKGSTFVVTLPFTLHTPT